MRAGWIKGLYLLLAVLVAITATGLVRVLIELDERGQSARYGRELVLWDLMNTSHLFNRLELSLTQYLHRPNPDTADELLYRYDLAYSRFVESARVLERPEYTRIDSAAALAKGLQIMRELEPLVEASMQVDATVFQGILRRMPEAARDIQELGIRRYKDAENLRIDRHAESHQLYLQVVELTAALLVVGCILVAVFHRQRQKERLAVLELDRANEELRNHGDNLQLLVDERTTELRETMELAQAANAAKSRFLANMSHELRTPMHSILGFARLGEKRAASSRFDEGRNYYGRILSSGNRLLSLLNDLLDLAKLEAGRMDLQLEPTTLGELIAAALTEIEAVVAERGLQLDVTGVDGAVPLHVDQDRLLQVLRNLLSNAIKFSPDGSCIRLSSESCEIAGAPAVAVNVDDEGPGIPEEELEIVFDVFIQSSETSSGAGGTGLGLAICREIVELHGGHVHAARRSSAGSRFTFCLPQAAMQLEAVSASG